MYSRLTILQELLQKGVSYINDMDAAWPQPYVVDIKQVKAIVLGCDPGTRDKRQFSHVFDLGTTKQHNPYFRDIEANLQCIGLTKADIYVQNLCQNYFTTDTSNNKGWKAAAAIWTDYLKQELDEQFDQRVPVLLTAGILYEVLLHGYLSRQKPIELYAYCQPVEATANKLGRPLYPLYRHHAYKLDKHLLYRDTLKQVFI